MARKELVYKYFRITHTVEENGPHPTTPYDFYDEEYSITVIIKGEGTCFVEGNSYSLKDGTIIATSPEEIHSYRLKQSGYHERLTVYFSKDVLSPLWDHELSLIQIFYDHPSGVGNCYGPDRYDQMQLLPVVEKLRDLVDHNESTYRACRAHLLILEFLFLLYDAAETHREISFVQDEKIAQICRYIKENLTERLSYEHLQEHFLISRYQLTTVFHRNTGMTLTEYILHKRLMQAIVLIRNGEGMETAAYRAGFHAYSHFYKAFKNRYHVSPKTYFTK